MTGEYPGGVRAPSAAEQSVLGERVFCDDEMGLSWSEVARLPEDIALNRTNAREAASLLRELQSGW